MRCEQTLQDADFGLVLDVDYRNLPYVVIDKSAGNEDFAGIDLSDPTQYDAYVHRRMEAAGASFAVGEYNEKRVIYDHSDLFAGPERRTIHVGMDLHFPRGTSVIAPMDGWVHSIADNQGVGDYGPTIILAHEVDGVRFHTLYGHLLHDSLDQVHEGERVTRGQRIGWIGTYPHNGSWAEHLHFQIIRDMGGMHGDYPAVVRESERAWYVENCPDPNLILRIPGLR